MLVFIFVRRPVNFPEEDKINPAVAGVGAHRLIAFVLSHACVCSRIFVVCQPFQCSNLAFKEK